MAVEAKGKGILVKKVREERWRVIGMYVRRRGIGETLRKLDGLGEREIVRRQL